MARDAKPFTLAERNNVIKGVMSKLELASKISCIAVVDKQGANSSSCAKNYFLVAAAYVSWGVLPIFWSYLSHVDPITVLYQRTVWSSVFLGILLLARGKLLSAFKSMASFRQLGTTSLSTCCLGLNWFSYVWAMKQNELFAAGLAYYLCPLLTMSGAALIFKERFTIRQKVAILLLIAGVSVPAISSGELPVLALVIATSWSAYTLLRRHFDRPALTAIWCEALTLAVVLSVLLPLLYGMSAVIPATTAPSDIALFITSGIVTAVPIVWLVNGMRTVPVKMVGLLQYLSPTLTLITSVLFFQAEPTSPQVLCILFIWSGLIVFFISELGLVKVFRPEGKSQQAFVRPPISIHSLRK